MEIVLGLDNMDGDFGDSIINAVKVVMLGAANKGCEIVQLV